MSKRQRRQSTADPPTAKSKITDHFQRNIAETNNGAVELVYVERIVAVVKLNFRIVICRLLLATYMYVTTNVGTNKP